MKRAEDYRQLLIHATNSVNRCLADHSDDGKRTYSLEAIACILLAKELREGGDVEEGESK